MIKLETPEAGGPWRTVWVLQNIPSQGLHLKIIFFSMGLTSGREGVPSGFSFSNIENRDPKPQTRKCPKFSGQFSSSNPMAAMCTSDVLNGNPKVCRAEKRTTSKHYGKKVVWKGLLSAIKRVLLCMADAKQNRRLLQHFASCKKIQKRQRTKNKRRPGRTLQLCTKDPLLVLSNQFMGVSELHPKQQTNSFVWR